MSRSSQVIYHEWDVRGGRVTCKAEDLEIRIVRWDLTALVHGLTKPKTIRYSEIISVQPVRNMIHVVFDTDDEIILHCGILKDLQDNPVPPFDLLEPIGGSLNKLVESMRHRQSQLAPVSWEKGRHGGKPQSQEFAKVIRLAPFFIALATLAGLWLTR